MHLPLVIPPGCALQVGNHVRTWTPGELLIFDDTIEHAAWNDSDHLRVVLIFDLWNPLLEPAERRHGSGPGEEERQSGVELHRHRAREELELLGVTADLGQLRLTDDRLVIDQEDHCLHGRTVG